MAERNGILLGCRLPAADDAHHVPSGRSICMARAMGPILIRYGSRDYAKRSLPPSDGGTIGLCENRQPKTAPQLAVDDHAARVLANATKTTAQLSTITPRWFSKLMPWAPVESDIYRVNKVKDASRVSVACSRRDEQDLPATFVDYEEHPREYLLSSITTTVGMSSRVAALYSGTRDQLGEQRRSIGQSNACRSGFRTKSAIVDRRKNPTTWGQAGRRLISVMSSTVRCA